MVKDVKNPIYTIKVCKRKLLYELRGQNQKARSVIVSENSFASECTDFILMFFFYLLKTGFTSTCANFSQSYK